MRPLKTHTNPYLPSSPASASQVLPDVIMRYNPAPRTRHSDHCGHNRETVARVTCLWPSTQRPTLGDHHLTPRVRRTTIASRNSHTGTALHNTTPQVQVLPGLHLWSAFPRPVAGPTFRRPPPPRRRSYLPSSPASASQVLPSLKTHTNPYLPSSPASASQVLPDGAR